MVRPKFEYRYVPKNSLEQKYFFSIATNISAKTMDTAFYREYYE